MQPDMFIGLQNTVVRTSTCRWAEGVILVPLSLGIPMASRRLGEMREATPGGLGTRLSCLGGGVVYLSSKFAFPGVRVPRRGPETGRNSMDDEG
jgi:hypothetical protein